MTDKLHRYRAELLWTGNSGAGTSGYRAYGRDHEIRSGAKPMIPGSADPAFRGDAARWNPEELLIASISACHQLWYLHLCADAGLAVMAYEDHAEGVMAEEPDGAGQFTAVKLRPKVRLATGADVSRAAGLHHRAHEKCFVARSLAFPVEIEPEFETAPGHEAQD